MFHVPAHKNVAHPAAQVDVSDGPNPACYDVAGAHAAMDDTAGLDDERDHLCDRESIEAFNADQALDVLCPACDGYPEALGQLGRLTHYRCRDCAWVFADH